MQNAKCRIQRTDTCEAVRTGDSPQRDLPVVRAERLLLFSIVHCPLSIMCAYVTAMSSGVSGLVRVVPGMSRLVTAIAHLLSSGRRGQVGAGRMGCGMQKRRRAAHGCFRSGRSRRPRRGSTETRSICPGCPPRLQCPPRPTTPPRGTRSVTPFPDLHAPALPAPLAGRGSGLVHTRRRTATDLAAPRAAAFCPRYATRAPVTRAATPWLHCCGQIKRKRPQPG
jgi:hypothetical protein